MPLIRPLALLALSAIALSAGCIERSPADDVEAADAAGGADGGVDGMVEPDDTDLPCPAAACADIPPLACEDGDGVCVPLPEGGCGRECPPPLPLLRMCPPADCGQPPEIECPPDTRVAAECPAEQRGPDCAWDVRCVPVGRPECSPDDCGPIPPGEACSPGTRSVSACRRENGECTWYLDCEPVGCQPEECGPIEGSDEVCGPREGDPVEECVTIDGLCEWRVTCFFHICDLEWDPGPCRGDEPAWWYNPETGFCEERRYGGCEGNINRFPSREQCVTYCGPVEDTP